MRIFKKLKYDNRGSSVIIEMAYITVLMILIFYGFTMFTNAQALDLAVKTAAREGAREYAITGNKNLGVAKAKQELDMSDVDSAKITPFTDGEGRGMKVEKRYEFNVPFGDSYGPMLSGVGIFVQEPLK